MIASETVPGKKPSLITATSTVPSDAGTTATPLASVGIDFPLMVTLAPATGTEPALTSTRTVAVGVWQSAGIEALSNRKNATGLNPNSSGAARRSRCRIEKFRMCEKKERQAPASMNVSNLQLGHCEADDEPRALQRETMP